MGEWSVSFSLWMS